MEIRSTKLKLTPNVERPILNVEVGKLDPSVSRHTSLDFCLPAAGKVTRALSKLFQSYFRVISINYASK